MDNKEDTLDALDEFAKKQHDATEKIPPLLEQYFRRVALSGETIFPWSKVRPVFVHKVDQVMNLFQKDMPVPDRTEKPLPNVENINFQMHRKRVLAAINNFNAAPFTIQRLCEMLIDPRKHYRVTEKFMRGLEKNVTIVSTVDPFGNKIVCESRAMVNGMDSNGFEDNGKAASCFDSPFKPPPAPPSRSVTQGSPSDPPPHWPQQGLEDSPTSTWPPAVTASASRIVQEHGFGESRCHNSPVKSHLSDGFEGDDLNDENCKDIEADLNNDNSNLDSESLVSSAMDENSLSSCCAKKPLEDVDKDDNEDSLEPSPKKQRLEEADDCAKKADVDRTKGASCTSTKSDVTSSESDLPSKQDEACSHPTKSAAAANSEGSSEEVHDTPSDIMQRHDSGGFEVAPVTSTSDEESSSKDSPASSETTGPQEDNNVTSESNSPTSSESQESSPSPTQQSPSPTNDDITDTNPQESSPKSQEASTKESPSQDTSSSKKDLMASKETLSDVQPKTSPDVPLASPEARKSSPEPSASSPNKSNEDPKQSKPIDADSIASKDTSTENNPVDSSETSEASAKSNKDSDSAGSSLESPGSSTSKQPDSTGSASGECEAMAHSGLADSDNSQESLSSLSSTSSTDTEQPMETN